MQNLYLLTLRSHISKRLINLIFFRSKNTSPVIPKAKHDIKEAAKEHVRELRREFEKPIKFSTSRAKYWDTADSIVFNRHIGKFTRPVLIVTVLINMVCFYYKKKERYKKIVGFFYSSIGVIIEKKMILTKCLIWNHGKYFLDLI